MKQFHVAFLFAFALAAPSTSWAQARTDQSLLGQTVDPSDLERFENEAGINVIPPVVGQRYVYKSPAGYTQGGIVQSIDKKTGAITLVAGESKMIVVVPGKNPVQKEPVVKTEVHAPVPAPVVAEAPKAEGEKILAAHPTDPDHIVTLKKAIAQAEAAMKVKAPEAAPQEPAKQEVAKQDAAKKPARELTEAELKERAKSEFEKQAEEIRSKILDKKSQFQTDARDADCATCSRYATEEEINEILAGLKDVPNLDPSVYRRTERELKAVAKTAIEDLRLADVEGKILKIEEDTSTKSPQRRIDEIARLVERVKPGRSKDDQDKYAEFCTNASRVVKRIGKDAFKEEEKEDLDDEEGGFRGGFRRFGQGLGMMASALVNPTTMFAGELGFTGRADEDEISELDVEADESGAAADRNSMKVKRSCLAKVTTSRAKKTLKNSIYNDVARMFNKLAASGPNNALNYYAAASKWRGSALGKDCRAIGKSVECMMLASGAQADAIRYYQGRQEMYKAYFDASKIDITMGTTTPSTVKDPATGADVLFPSVSGFNQSLIKGTVPNPLTNPVADAKVTPMLGSANGLQIPNTPLVNGSGPLPRA